MQIQTFRLRRKAVSLHNGLRLLLCAFVAMPLLACAGLPQQGAVASADPLATQAGYEVLAAGGNAFDAAVAIAATLGVVEPAASGLGGGGFFLLYVASDNSYRFVDAREVAPAAARPDMYLDRAGKPVPRASTDGPLAAGIPGLPAGLVHLTENYGSMPLGQLLQPAIAHAEQGFAIGRRALLGLRFRQQTLLQSPAMSQVFYPGDKLPVEGALIVQPDLARTLRALAAEGNAGFYGGETARLLVDGTRRAGGIWTLEDLATYRVVEREPLVTTYQGMRVISAPPPSSAGVVLAQIFNFLDGYPLAELDSALQSHYRVEAMRRAYRDRALYLADPDFEDLPLELLLSPGYMAGQRVSVRADRATPSDTLAGMPAEKSEGDQTTHFSVLDRWGNRVAATITINTWYGSGFIPPGTGVILNNEMDDFAIKPWVPNEFGLVGTSVNAVAPGKRPLSSMAPTFLESERGIAIVGTPGGSRIITMVLNAALAWHAGATAEAMVSGKRYHHQYLPDVVSYEPGAFSEREIASLKAKGHRLSPTQRSFGNMNVVTWDFGSDFVEVATDPRGTDEGEVY